MEVAQASSIYVWIKHICNTHCYIAHKNVGIYTIEFYLAVKKKKKITLHNSMDGPGEHYSKLNKPVRIRQIPYDLTHVGSNGQTELASKIETDLQRENCHKCGS